MENTAMEQGYLNFVQVPHQCGYCGIKQIHEVPTVCLVETQLVALEYPIVCHKCKRVKSYSVRTKQIKK